MDEKRHTNPIKVKMPKLEVLLRLKEKVKKADMTTFTRRYGHILKLLDTNVDVRAMVALYQYYDSPLWCFTFQDFQLTPTIEEFEILLGWPLKGGIPFTSLGERVTCDRLAEVLYLPVREVAPLCKAKGIPRKALENKAKELAEAGNTNAFYAVLALLIFGIVMFPSGEEEFVEEYAVNVFVSRKNPVPALVADVLYHLHIRHEKKRGVVLCCTPLLYSWFLSHLSTRGPWYDVLKDLSWAQTLACLTSDALVWYLPNWNVGEIITNCGDFPNVPLMGSQGCINYNPRLALRQLGYPLETEPNDAVLEELLLEDFGRENPQLLRQIRSAWTRIHRKGRELGKRDCVAKEPYKQWVMGRVKEVKLPYAPVVSVKAPELEATHVPIEEFNKLKLTITEMRAEEGRQQAILTRVARERDDLMQSLKERDDELLKSQEQVDKERKAKFRVKDN
jgi:hypothetical protein